MVQRTKKGTRAPTPQAMTTLSDLNSIVCHHIEEILPELISMRHDIHSHPELGYEEQRTSGIIQQCLSDYKVPFVSGLAKGTGVLGFIEGEGDKAVALRADIDALPIAEENTFDWKSVHEGCMHACGHDGHTTILLGAAKVLSRIANKQVLPNPVTFVFQPAEEGGGGGQQMVLDGCLDGSQIGQPVGMMFGLHGWPQLQLHHVATRAGPMLAADIGINVTIRGIGGHAAFPHLCKDSIVCAAHIITSVHQLASRNTDPLDSLVVSITQIHGGTTHNIIPDEVHLSGTMRYLKQETGEMAKQRFTEIVNGVASAHGCEASITLLDGYPVTKNHPEAVITFFDIAKQTIDPSCVSEFENPVMGGRGFLLLLQRGSLLLLRTWITAC